jgi:post-segregation antitoxin (ccd killing protein)
MTAEKITVTIPHDLKEKLVNIKDELKISMSAIYKEALEAYLEKKELEKWEKGALLASADKEYISLSKELGNIDGKIHEY